MAAPGSQATQPLHQVLTDSKDHPMNLDPTKTDLLPRANPSALFARSRGHGDVVVCLHSSTGSHAQWRGLADVLAWQGQVITPDLHGHGRSPGWPHDRANTLQVDARGVVNALNDCREPGGSPGLHLVGHSYGGAVALQIALDHPRLVKSLTLYEPVAFGMLWMMGACEPELDEIEDIADSVAALVRIGELEGAARIFVGYWGGPLAWEAMAPAQRAAVIARVPTVPRHFDALFRATWSARSLESLTMPVLLMHGSQTRAPARSVVELLGEALPHASRIEFAGAGHLGPMTHATPVDAAIAAHLGANGLAPQPVDTEMAAA
ncbi:alpha/beta hydrolase [soil metagenome]